MIKKTIILLVSALILTSCEDFLTQDVRGTENIDTYFQTEEEVNAYVGGCYREITTKNGWWMIYKGWNMFDMVSDDLWDGNTTQGDEYQSATHFFPTAQDNGPLHNYYNGRCLGITTCNIGIARITESPIDENLKKQRLAEIRFLRAFFYFEMVRNFGGVPLVTTPISSGEGITRASIEECYEFIEKELSEVAEILPQRSEYPAEDMGRATSGAALGILGKAQLYQAKWEDAKATLWKIIDEGEYSLMDNFGDVWSAKHNNNKESIFEVQTMYSGENYMLGGCLSVVSGCRNGVGDGWARGQPTSDLENAYLNAGDTERLRWTIIKTGCTEIAGENQFDKFIENNTSVCAVTDQKFLDYKENFGWTDEMYKSTYIIDPAQHKSARINRKYFVPLEDRPEIYNIDRIPLNHRILRYADVLLMYAEACNEVGADGDAREYLNQVRNRVGLLPVNKSGKELRDAIRLERRLELAFEQNRLYDIRRWDDDNGKKVICNIFGPNGSFVKYNTGENADKYEKWNQGEPSDKGIRFDENRDLLFPIPMYEIQHSNGAIVQNPGW